MSSSKLVARVETGAVTYILLLNAEVAETPRETICLFK